jgi:hypothetical protein
MPRRRVGSTKDGIDPAEAAELLQPPGGGDAFGIVDQQVDPPGTHVVFGPETAHVDYEFLQ